MRLGVISDIHSNLEALTTTLEILQTENVDEVICIGDIVGYGANPNECIDLVRRHCSVGLLGNHDLAAADLRHAEYFTSLARAAIEWTSRTLTPEGREFLRGLPYTAVREDLLFVHASPEEPGEWNYIISAMDARGAFRHFSEKICFVGHSHVPGVYAETGSHREVGPDDRFIVNVGSVGQPRDGNPQLSFGIFDTGTWTYRNIRKEYDVRGAGKKILNAGLPSALAQRLVQGV